MRGLQFVHCSRCQDAIYQFKGSARPEGYKTLKGYYCICFTCMNKIYSKLARISKIINEETEK